MNAALIIATVLLGAMLVVYMFVDTVWQFFTFYEPVEPKKRKSTTLFILFSVFLILSLIITFKP